MVVFAANAQQKKYTPNARQAVQKSRMQPPQYMEVTQPEVEADTQTAAPVIKAATPAKPVNYQVERPVAIDAPKRRGNKGAIKYAKLASNKK